MTVLMAMKIKLKDKLNVMNGWDINSVDTCTWNMVACSTEGFVVSLLDGLAAREKKKEKIKYFF